MLDSATANEVMTQQLHCCVRMEPCAGDNGAEGKQFLVEISGSILATGDGQRAILKMGIEDVTDGVARAKTVLEKRRRSGLTRAPVFGFQTILGQLTQKVTTLKDWTTVARIPEDWLLFARKGRRSLLFNLDVVTCEANLVLASTRYLFDYMNGEFGYVDIRENTEQAHTLAIAVGCAVAAADGSLAENALGFIRGWCLAGVKLDRVSVRGKRQFEKALQKIVSLFRKTPEGFDIERIANHIREITVTAVRYDILQYCLQIAALRGEVSGPTLRLLWNLAAWFDVDVERFRAMVTKILPVDMHEAMDVEVLLGLQPDMDREEILNKLNREYAKWNSRVTNTDKDVQTQADQMLEIIAQTRQQYSD